MEEYNVYTYIYGELDENDNIVYVGRSFDPRLRNINKKAEKNSVVVSRFIILDKFIDPEQRIIHNLTSNGVKLRNREVITECGDYEIGKTYDVYIKNKLGKRVRHIPTQMIFESKCYASRYFGYKDNWLTELMNPKRKSPYKEEWEYVS